MARFWKRFSTLIFIILAALVVLAVVVWMRLPSFAATLLSSKMKVPVHIEDLSISKELIDLKKLEIGNPHGFSLPRAFSTDQIQVAAPIGNYLDTDVVIDKLTMDQIYVGLEFASEGSSEGNWTTIMRNMKGKEPAEKKKGGKTVLIKHIVLTDLSVDLLYQKSGSVRHLPKMNKIELHNISSEGGLPINQIMNVVLQQMLLSIFKEQGLKNMLDSVIQIPGVPLQELSKPFGNLFGMIEIDGQQSAL